MTSYLVATVKTLPTTTGRLHKLQSLRMAGTHLTPLAKVHPYLVHHPQQTPLMPNSSLLGSTTRGYCSQMRPCLLRLLDYHAKVSAFFLQPAGNLSHFPTPHRSPLTSPDPQCPQIP